MPARPYQSGEEPAIGDLVQDESGRRFIVDHVISVDDGMTVPGAISNPHDLCAQIGDHEHKMYSAYLKLVARCLVPRSEWQSAWIGSLGRRARYAVEKDGVTIRRDVDDPKGGFLVVDEREERAQVLSASTEDEAYQLAANLFKEPAAAASEQIGDQGDGSALS